MAFVGAPQSAVMVDGVVMMPMAVTNTDPNLKPTVRGVQPGMEAVYYEQEMADAAKCIYPFYSGCTLCCWDSVRNRAFVKVTETQLTFNYPFVHCIFCWASDNIWTEMIDKPSTNKLEGSRIFARRDTCCSPWHCCYCVECCGQVVQVTNMECCNNAICAILFPCPCFNKFYPGFRDADGFVRALNNACDNMVLKAPAQMTMK